MYRPFPPSGSLSLCPVGATGPRPGRDKGAEEVAPRAEIESGRLKAREGKGCVSRDS